MPDTTFRQLEKAFRNKHFNVYIIGVVSRQPTVASPTLFRALTRHQEADESKPHTIISLQGKRNCKYQVRFSMTAYPKRKATAEGWPPSPEENLKRLLDAGFVEDRGVSKCTNCNGEAEPEPRPSSQVPGPTLTLVGEQRWATSRRCARRTSARSSAPASCASTAERKDIGLATVPRSASIPISAGTASQ